MKPISLTVAGLHSFREKQVIDFSSLCEGGVFGIFGPTGSGKSSILDAMTLALYGKVERASNNTLGILNHAEEQLHVSLTFELQNANGAKRYMIERSFKRADELRVKSSVSRLIEVNEESVVLADKIGEVNQQIQELLGLTIDDFTRAVVLPQGKFAEFLSLKGVDRRQMLQRLFNLEQYGDKLNKKLKNKLSTAKSELNEVVAEQTGLGDASTEAIKQAETELSEVEILLNKRQTELKKVEEQFEQSKKIWDWQQQKLTLATKLNEVEREKDHIQQLESKVKLADTADKVFPYLEEFEASNIAVMEWTNRHKEVHSQLEINKLKLEKSLENYNQARLEKTKQLPILLTKKQKLIEAKVIQEKAVVLENELRVLHGKLNALKKQTNEKQQLITNLSDVITRGLEKQKMLKEEQSKLTVSASERDVIRKAYEQKQLILHNNETLRGLLEEKNKKQKQLAEAEKMFATKNELLSKQKKLMESLFSKTDATYHAICEIEVDSEKVILRAENEQAKQKQQLEEMRTKNLAIQLASQLKEGAACPVCGSTEHPNPLVMHDDQVNVLQKEIEHLTDGIRQAQEVKQQITTLKLQLEQISHGLVQEYPGHLEVQIKENPPVKEIDVFPSIYSKLDHLQIEIKSFNQDYLQLKETGRKAIQEVRALTQSIAQIESTKENLQMNHMEIQEKVTSLSKRVENQKAEWNQIFTNMQFDSIETKMAEISTKDKNVQELTAQLDHIAKILEQREQESGKHQEDFNQFERNVIELTSALQNKDEALHEHREKLSQEIGENDINQLLSETEQLLKNVEEKEASTYEIWLHTQQICQQLENETHAAAQSLTESKSRLEKSTAKWNEVKSETNFLSIEDVKSAILSKNDQEIMKRTIEEYSDKVKQLFAELTNLNELLNGKEISFEKWQDIQKIREEIKEMVNEAVEAKGAALKALQVLQEKHVRFNELEGRRTELDALVEQYHQLQAVFKGNSFVEYIAEEQLVQVSRDATERLGILTRQRYAIEVDSQGGFIMRDDANGGVRRPVTSLSGGETFLTSLALALSLSAQIQLRGEYPLQFFFLDEGFGTLDADLLDTVVSALEKLHSKQLAVGVISHVQELRARLPKRLIVIPAEPSGRGTQVKIETL
ncbi:SbcC/MukB-like Walker B domain-containing protein [Ferdinandcohnia quinoae]|uniref:Nuclease SbcCD subunit C n=1 Tax=Fredinandcohnia quinoae TaxID=2918902 RepID=A0AAW5DZP9_9BACI|nr:SMC family ATPase [Fredinandcohnia sp. SECRCQ15]MCH1625823.1 SMC family ATPase [Fredinandcohnia sp. SECRCQ15]